MADPSVGGTAAQPLFDEEARRYDAVLVVAFGGPEGPADVGPFLSNVLRNRPLPPAAKARIAERYQAFGGVSPINGHTRAFVAALEERLREAGQPLPVYWGNRNWHPYLGETVQRMAAAGVRRAVAYVASVFSSYSSCRQYREDLFAAVQGGPAAPRIDKLRQGWNHPGFIEAMAARVRAARRETGVDAVLVFTAHSLPRRMADRCAYEAQLREACTLVAAAAAEQAWQLAYQSGRAGGPDPWLAPTVDEALRQARDAGRRAVLLAPIGFVCDHMEVVQDLDVDACRAAEALGLRYVRAATVGTHPAYVDMVRQLIEERMAASPSRLALGTFGPLPDLCPADCCLSDRPGLLRPALAGAEHAAHHQAG